MKYSYAWYRYEAISIRRGRREIAFMQGEDASALYDELNECKNEEQEQNLLSQYDMA